MRKRRHSKYRYYSQNGEDYLLWRLFDYKENGFYVDVGAFDGVHLSNSYSFEQQGWSGICVEPHPSYFELCKELRPRSICVNVACIGDDQTGKVEFYTEKLGLLSGIMQDREEDVQARYKNRDLVFEGFKRIGVAAATLNAILNEYGPGDTEIDFVSIDVEGAELEVLRGLNLSQFRPRVLVVETNTEDARVALNSYLVKLNHYYEARRLCVNTIYAREKDDVERIQSIRVACEIERTLHPLGEKYTIYGRAIQGRKTDPKLALFGAVRKFIGR